MIIFIREGEKKISSYYLLTALKLYICYIVTIVCIGDLLFLNTLDVMIIDTDTTRALERESERGSNESFV